MNPKPFQHRTRQAILITLGSLDGMVLILAALLLVSMGWFGNALQELIKDLCGPLTTNILLSIFPLLLIGLALFARRYRNKLRMRITEDPDPAPARGLVMFLSALRPEDEERLRTHLEAKPLDLGLFRDLFGQLSWRMNIEAIHYHQARLRRIMVLPSTLSTRQYELFKSLVETLWSQGTFKCHQHNHPLDYLSDLDTLICALQDTLQDLGQQHRIPPSEQVLDITSGTGMATAAATALAVSEGRRLQYVKGDQQRTQYQILQIEIHYET